MSKPPRRIAAVLLLLSTSAWSQIRIHDIQGPGDTSPLVGQTVTFSGIVTANKFNGFFVQEPDASADGNPATSEGIFIFTNSPSGPAVGSGVTIAGTVTEFVPANPPGSLPITEMTSSLVNVTSTGNPLPTAVLLTAADTSPAGGVGQLERFEGMRVQVPSLTVVGPTEGSVNETTQLATSNGVFYGVITGIMQPAREPGISVLLPLPPGSPPGVPRFDTNPERLRVDSDGQLRVPPLPPLDVATGAIVTGLSGVLDYASGDYTILPDPGAQASGGSTVVPVPTPTADELTIATCNLRRFYDAANDPAIAEPVLTTMAFANRLAKVSALIRDVLHSPDVIGVQEVENLATLETIAATINADAVASGGGDPGYVAYLEEGNDVAGIDVGFLVKGRVQALGVTQIGTGETFANPLTGLPEATFDRPPLRLDATVPGPDRNPTEFTVIVNHLRSLNGIDDLVQGPFVRAKRRAQAESLATHVQAAQAAKPQRSILVVGDFNAFEFNDGYVDTVGTVKGTPTPADQVVVASPDLVDPDLLDAAPPASNTQPSSNYSFVFQGSRHTLDRILVNAALMGAVTGFAYGRGNADAPETDSNDPGPQRISDHDPPVVYLSLPDTTTTTLGPGGTTTTTTSGPAETTTTTTSGPPDATTTTTLPPCTSSRCLVDEALRGPACAGLAVPANVSRKIDQSIAALDAAGNQPAKKAKKTRARARKLFKAAATAATRSAQGRKPRLADECADAIRSVLGRLAASIPR